MPDLDHDDTLPIMRFDHLHDLEGWLWRREGARLAYLASRVPAGQVIVEIGSYRGKSTAYLAHGSKAGNNVEVHAVDLWDLGGQLAANNDVHGYDAVETFETFDAQLRRAGVRSMVVAHKSDSVEAGLNWSGPPVGLLFIDGLHEREQIAREVDAWLPHM